MAQHLDVLAARGIGLRPRHVVVAPTVADLALLALQAVPQIVAQGDDGGVGLPRFLREAALDLGETPVDRAHVAPLLGQRLVGCCLLPGGRQLAALPAQAAQPFCLLAPAGEVLETGQGAAQRGDLAGERRLGKLRGAQRLFRLLARLARALRRAGGAPVFVVGALQAVAGVGKLASTRRQVAPRVAAGEALAQRREAALDGAQPFAQRPRLLLELLLALAQGGQPGLSEAWQIGCGVAAATPFAQIALTTHPVLAARQAGAGGGVLDALRALQQVDQPLRHRAAQPQHLEQRARAGRRHADAFGNQIVPVTQALAKDESVFGLPRVVQQNDVRERSEDGFDGIRPALVGDLESLCEQRVADARALQCRAETTDILRVGAPAGVEVMQQFGNLRQLGAAGGELQAQRIPLGFGQLERLLVGKRIAALDTGRREQTLALLEPGQPAGPLGIGLVERRIRRLLGGLGGEPGGDRELHGLPSQRLLVDARLQLVAQPPPVAARCRQLATRTADRFVERVKLEPWPRLGSQRLPLARQGLPLEVTVDLLLEAFEFVGEPRLLTLHRLQLGIHEFLMRARLGVAVERLLVAKDLEDEIEQFPARQLAELVGLSLFERQHPRQRRRQPGLVQQLPPVADTVLGALGLDALDRHITRREEVDARPVAALALDAAGQRHLFLLVWRPERTAVVGQPTIVDDRPQPGKVFPIAPHVALVVTLAAAVPRAFECQQRAQRVEQRRLARPVGTDDGDDWRRERDLEPLPVVPVDQFQFFEAEHQSAPPARWRSRSPSAPCRMRGASSA
ncbi:MAG: hypothetical protein AW07_01983 [Candidatus Accumulibacter sp. SK-11]|nr:MAG: hypothetical protein AW07_01983 [Candidatus Accumulibacter sp. SK-11]